MDGRDFVMAVVLILSLFCWAEWKTRKRETVVLDSSAFDSVSSLSDDDLMKDELLMQPSHRHHRRSGSSSNAVGDSKSVVAAEANRDKKLIRCDMLK